MTSYGPPEPHWLDPAKHTIRKDIDRGKKPERQMASLAALTLYLNAVYYPNYRASATESPASLPLDTISHIFYAFAA
jgi:GH18 family chitinase